MSEINQAILVSSITVITILLTIIGIQVAFVFREMRRSIQKVNKIIDDAGSVSGVVSKSVNEIDGVADGMKAALKVFRVFKPKQTKEKNRG